MDKPAIVINLHGFSGNLSGHKSAHTHMARALERAGIACARFDFYGNGESDGEFEDMTFTSLLEDTEDIYKWVSELEFIDKNKIILSGQSLGGFVAASAAPRIKPFGLILMCPGAGMWYGCKERADKLKEQGIYYGDVEGLKFSLDFNYDLAKYNPFEDAKGYDGPVLVLRGTKDALVDNETCKRYLELYHGKKEYVQIEGGDHNFGNIQARENCEATIIKFVKEIIK